jgi:hypothetical protein
VAEPETCEGAAAAAAASASLGLLRETSRPRTSAGRPPASAAASVPTALLCLYAVEAE